MIVIVLPGTANVNTRHVEAREMDEEVDSADRTITADDNTVLVSTEDMASVGQPTTVQAVQPTSVTQCAAPGDSNLDIGLYVHRNFTLTDDQKYNVLQNPWGPPVGFCFPCVVQKNQRRFFNSGWLDRYSSLSYSKLLGGALCRACVLFAPEFSGKGSHQTVEQFVTKACTNWKDFHELCRFHTKCKYHEIAVELAGNFQVRYMNPKADIMHILDQSLADSETKARKALLPIVKTVLFCGRQGLAFRGHNESGDILKHVDHNDGNFRALLRFRIDAGDADLQTHLTNAAKNAQYISPSIQNELISCAGKLITDEIAARVNAARSFTILADETTDSSCKEQLSVCIRYVHHDTYDCPQLREDFVGFVDVSSDLTADGLSSAILQLVQSVGIDLGFCHGQGYDGASAMSGRLNGVQAIIRKSYPLALYTHCASHCLNLALGKACTVPIIRNSLGAVTELVSFFSHSAQRCRLLEETVDTLHDEDTLSATRRKRLKHLCETWWIERHESLLALIELFPAVLRCLEAMQMDGNVATARTAATMQHSLTSCANLMGLTVAQHMSSLLLPVTTMLQTKSIDLISCCAEVDAVVTVLKKYRDSSDTFAEIFAKCSSLCSMSGTAVTIPRLVGRQQHRCNVVSTLSNLQQGAQVSAAETPEQTYYRINVFNPFVDYLITELSNRFLCHRSNAFTLQCFVPKFCCTSTVADARPAIAMYQQVLEGSPSDVEAEFQLWLTKCLSGSISADDAFSAYECCPPMYTNVKFLLKILCTLPVTTASAERTFSMLRRLKTWLRSTMCEERLTGLALLSSAMDIPVEPDDVVDKFMQRSSRRIC